MTFQHDAFALPHTIAFHVSFAWLVCVLGRSSKPRVVRPCAMLQRHVSIAPVLCIALGRAWLRCHVGVVGIALGPTNGSMAD